jgi:hypothetical protein
MRRVSLVLAALITIMLVFAAPRAAFAHERRTIAGKFDVVVGWDNEPALVGLPNAAGITIYKTGTKDPVEGAEKTLKVQIAFGGNTPKEFELEPSDETKGHYSASLIPTRAGSYIFTFVGTIDETPVNEKFESGPNRFDDVSSGDDMQFPQTVPDSAALANDVKAARDDASSARSLAIVGIVVGALGLLTAGAALLTGRRAKA